MTTKTTTTPIKKTLDETERIKIRDGLMLRASRRMGCTPRDLFVAACIYSPDRFYEWLDSTRSVIPYPLDIYDVKELAEGAVEGYFDGIRQILLPDFVEDVCVEIMRSRDRRELDDGFKDVLFAIVRESNKKKK